MYAPTSTKLSFTAAAVPDVPPRALPTAGSWTRVLAVLALGTAALVGIGAGAQWDRPTSTLAQDVEAFQQRVSAGATASSDASANEVLAQRYLGTLAPDLRQRISEQVRAEQQAGVTAAGNDAFVMRRLALYEAALQQQRAGTAMQAGSNMGAR